MHTTIETAHKGEARKMTLEQFKLAVLSFDEFSDAQVEKLFLDVEVTSEKDIRELVGILQEHRPQVLKNIESKNFLHPVA